MELATRIKQARTTANLTQEAAAKAWRVNLGTLRQWEQGIRTPRGLAKEALTDILDAILSEDKPAAPASSASPATAPSPAATPTPSQPKAQRPSSPKPKPTTSRKKPVG